MITGVEVTQLKQANDVSLQHHAVIEASAGTGKTYTLIELVMRLLIEQRLPLEKILIMTFTEQATGELKSRIRQRIQQELHNAQHDFELHDHLEQCLLNINQASVFTIHSFCQGALKEFAFEQGAVFETELVNDNELRERLLKQLKRSWPADQALLKQLSFYTAEHRIQELDALLLDLAKQFNPEFDVFYPQLDQLDEQTLLDMVTGLDLSQIAELEQQFKSLQGLAAASHKSLWQERIEPFLLQLTSLQAEINFNQINALFKDTFDDKEDVCKEFFFRKPAVYDANHATSQAEVNRQAAPDLFAVIDQINAIWANLRLVNQTRKFQAIPKLLQTLNEHTKQHKINHSLISYDDMITRLWQQLISEQQLSVQDQLLSQSLRKKYQFAMVDEFQDTDRRQWQIFQHLFLDSPDAKQKLLVIGDPKQAIYGFRGADLHTYHQATATLLQQYAAKAYRLEVNYRTEKSLVDGFNRFFAIDEAGNGWFPKQDVVVQSAETTEIDPEQIPRLISNPHHLKPINTLVTATANIDEVKSDLARQIALTIKQKLLNRLQFRLKGQEKSMQPSDICVLVRSNSEAEFVEEALRAVKVPYTFHKKRNLYQSDEAIHFQVLLTALARPHEHRRVNNALLTLFFGLKPEQLQDFAEEKLPEINNLWLQVKAAVADKNWIKAFDLLLHESGALFRIRNNSRQLANVKQLKQQLLAVALKGNLEANGLLKEFQSWREQKSNDEDLHQKDTEQQAVKIMTMHISKGLEFPVVFLFGDFTHRDTSKYHSYYYEDKNCQVFDMVKAHKEKYQQQQIEEAKQLYYVAMTRAIFMLFLPQIDETEKKLATPGFCVQTVMQRAAELNLPCEDIEEVQTANEHSTASTTKIIPATINPPESLPVRRRVLHSFSSLSKFKSQQVTLEAESDFAQSLTAELMVGDQFLNPAEANALHSSQKKTTIPGGVKTGLVLHGVFEHVDFELILNLNSLDEVYRQPAVMAVIEQQMQQFKLENKPLFNESGEAVSDYQRQMAAWVWHTLKKPLDALQGQCLASVKVENRCHELSFFWHKQQTHLTGFIDLFFAVPGAEGVTDYYILDWKSNLSANGYAPETLAEEVMTKHQYNWQYQLYALAMQRWFDALDLKNARLQGALYVFSRGMDCLETAQNGVFYDDFSNSSWQLAEIEAELLALNQVVQRGGV